MLERILLSNLLEWQQRKERQPLLVNGARQTGKTYLLRDVFSRNKKFRRCYYLDFERDPDLKYIFDDGFNPNSVIANIGLKFGESVSVSQDLIIFDEVGTCDKALQSLKYISEQLPHAFVIATGSNIGMLKSFPVGKVQLLNLYPLTFEEFLKATAPSLVFEAYKEMHNSSEAHRQIWSALLDYFYVGGMPNAINHWIAPEHGLVERVQDVRKIHHDLIDNYSRDFGKYSGPGSAQQIESVFRNIPLQLGQSMDGSVKRFRFREPIEGKKRYMDLRGPIDWLFKAKLVSKNYPITHKPQPPLPVQIKENIFKLFLFDVGLLGFMAGMSYEDHKRESTTFKGFIAENFVQNELIAQGFEQTFSWEQNSAQIEFVVRNNQGKIIPVEVKSGKRTHAKSLASYIDRYKPDLAIKLTGARGGGHGILQTLPIYYASSIPELIES